MLKMYSHQRFDNILIRNERDPPDDEDEEEGEKRERERSGIAGKVAGGGRE